MSNLSPEEVTSLIKENTMLKRRMDRMSKEMKNFVALHDKALKLREFSEREKNIQFEYNILLLENAPDIIFILDTDLRFRLGSKAFIHLLGHKDSETLLDLHFDTLFKDIAQDDWIKSTRNLFESVMKEQRQMQYNDEVDFNGRKIFTILIAPAIDTNGKIMGVICLMHDSTEIIDTKDAAEAATLAKSSFLASMSHEIRTPMNAIKGFSDLLALTGLSNQQAVYVNNIINATASLLVIINDILDFSKIEANKYEITRIKYDTVLELSEFCNLIQPKVDEKGIYFFTDIDPDLPSELMGDNLRIRQVLMNIIGNAVKFTHDGGIIFSVHGEPISDDEWLISYNIKDTGQGIMKDAIPKIFQAFEQTDIYKNRNISGTGLGLAISRSLTRLMGGDIFVKSEYGVGSEFTITIPQVVSNKSAIVHINKPQEKLVMLISHDDMFIKLMKDLCERLGILYVVLLNEESLNSMPNHGPTHVLIDDNPRLAETIACKFTKASIACLQGFAFVEFNLALNVKTIFKPLLVFEFVSFINNVSDMQDDVVTDDKDKRVSFADSKVLIVDDNDINLMVASEILKSYDINADTASSGVEAITMVKKVSYDIVFMDHMMPGMDGIEATALIRAMDIVQPCIVALTANAMLGMEDMYKKNGFDDYITKPIDINSLVSVLQKYL